MSFITDFDAIVDCPGLELQELGLLAYFFRNQGEGFVFLTDVIESKFGISAPTYHKIKKKLSKNHFISSVNVRENGKVKGCKITVLIDNIIAAAKNSKLEKAEFNNSEFKSSEFKKVEVRNVEFNEAEFNKNGHINGVNKKGSKSIKGVNGVREGDSVPAAPCDTIPAPEIPAGTQTSLLPPDIPPAPVPAPEKKTKFTPPTVAEISQHISEKLQENHISWLPEQITGTAEIIFNFYDSKGWKVGKETMKNWKSCVSGWLGRDNWVSRVRPRQSQSQQLPAPSFPGAPVTQQAPKSFREQDRDYANRHLRDPFGTAISDCVDAAIIMGGDPCDYGLAPQFHEEAMKLMQQRKEQAAKGHNINPDDVLTPGNQR